MPSPAIASAPAWQTTNLPVVTVGVALSGLSVRAAGSPAPTYSIVSGAPVWLSINSTTGELTGTPTTPPNGDSITYAITFRATNASGSTDIVLGLLVVTAVTITTTALPGGEEGCRLRAAARGDRGRGR
jgi:hypothetical protein